MIPALYLICRQFVMGTQYLETDLLFIEYMPHVKFFCFLNGWHLESQFQC